MKKILLTIGLALAAGAAAYAAKADPQGELTAIFSENFSGLVNGTESEPAQEEISVYGKVDTSLTGGHEWKGRGLHEAGGALAVMHFEQSDWFGTELVQGYVRTPYADIRMDGGNFTLRFRARTLSAETEKLHIELYDPYTTNSIDSDTVRIYNDWAVYEVDFFHPGYGNHLAFMEMASDDADWLLDDFEIVQDYYALSAPIVHFAKDVSYEQFTGYWNAVPLADNYLVSVYSLDASGNRQYLLEDEKTADCAITVDGTKKGTDYYYFVRSANDKYTSAESEIRQIHVPLNTLETPVAIAAENVSTDGFTARWEPTFRAMGYIIGLQKQYIATEDAEITIMHEDFNKFTDGDVDWPYSFYGNIDDYTSLAGWGYNYFAFGTANGMVAIDNSYKKYGEECFLSTPALDLSGNGGNFTVNMKVYGDKDNVVSLTCGNKTLTYTLTEQGDQEFSLDFDNGTAASVIRIEFDGEPVGYYSYLFVDDVEVTQTVKAGEPISQSVGTFKTENPVTSYEFTGLAANPGDTFIYTVTAWSYSQDESGMWGPDIFSEASAPQAVVIGGGTTGVDNIAAESTAVYASGNCIIINTPEATAAEIYAVDGHLVGRYAIPAGSTAIAPATTGILIVKVANRAFRLLLR